MREEEKKLAEELLFGEEKKPSFAKQLYFGKFDNKLVFPYPEPKKGDKQSDDAFISKVAEFARSEIDPIAIDRDAKIPDSVLKGLSTMGVLGMNVPQEYGGLAMSQHAYCKTVETIANRCASTALFINVHQSIGMRALLLYGTDEQKKRWLPSLAKGEIYAAFSLTEPNAGSDANGIETRAVFVPEKNVYRINGRKQWTSNGSIAKVLTVMAKTEDDKVTAFLVTPDMPGFKVLDRSLEKLGMRGTWTANLAFENMEVPAANILGEKGKGLKICLTVLDYGRTTFGALCTGVAKALLEKAVTHAVKRHQFHRPLASFGLVKKKIALINAYTYAMDATTYLTAGLIDNNVEDIMLESAMLKVFASDALWRIIYDTMQIYGGRSFFTDAPFERMLRDARLNMIGEGSNEVMRAFIGAVGMRDVGMQMKNPLNIPKLSMHWLFAPKVEVRSPHLQQEAKQLSKATRRFARVIPRLLAKYREDVVEQQLALDRIATAAMCLYTTTAVLSKLDAYPNDKDLAIGKFYCQHALGALHRHLDSLFQNDDSDIESLSDLITGL
jgi:alkylation response protein AidB-like acyl-CoA dehydrogenase